MTVLICYTLKNHGNTVRHAVNRVNDVCIMHTRHARLESFVALTNVVMETMSSSLTPLIFCTWGTILQQTIMPRHYDLYCGVQCPHILRHLSSVYLYQKLLVHIFMLQAFLFLSKQ